MGQLRDIMGALADALADIDGANQVEGRMCLEPSEPCIDVYPADPLEEADERGFGFTTGALLFIVRARVGVQDFDAVQDILLDWMDGTSDTGVAALLETDQTLGGLASSVDVAPSSGYVSFLDVNGAVNRLGAQWIVRVIPAVS